MKMSVALWRAGKSPRLSLPFWRWSVLLATCFGIGNLPGYPVLTGSLVMSLLAPFLLWPLYVWGGAGAVLLAVMVITWVGTVALRDVEKHGVKSDHDARAVVIDELAGSGLTLALGWGWLHAWGVEIPGSVGVQLLYLGVLFRLFDITKPFPAGRVDVRWHAPFAVMADDLIAAFYAALVAPLPFILIH